VFNFLTTCWRQNARTRYHRKTLEVLDRYFNLKLILLFP
jgi:hypothetical protein